MAAGEVISVVISTLDRPAELARCLDALLVGTRLPDEIVVVDQSADGAPVADVVTARAGRGPDLVHLRQERRGLSPSQNLGVSSARGDVVAVIDDDCVADPAWIEVVARTFEGDDAPDVVGGRILPMTPDGDRTVAVSSRTSERRAELRWPALPWDLGSGGNFAVRRERYLAVGGNDERLGTGTPGRGGNDLDLFFRLLRAGARARYEPDLLIHHERVTAAQHRKRREGYGFGVGAGVGRWLRDGERWAWRVLLAWLALRVRTLRHNRSWSRAVDELHIAWGTILGMVYGLRAGGRWPTSQTGT